jgi:ABC-2 type transport system permease protein
MSTAGLAGKPFWPYVWLLLRLRLQIMLRDFQRAKRRKQVGMIVLAALFVAFLGFVFFASWWLLRLFNSPELAQLAGDLSVFLAAIPVLIMSVCFLGILFTSFGVLLQVLYLSKDMDFLLAAPVPIRAVFVAKLLQAILPNLGLISLFALPVLFGLGITAGYSWLYFPMVVVMLCALALGAAGISSLLVIGVVRLFSARRVAELLGFLGAIMTMICSQSGQLARFEDVGSEQAQAAVQLATRYNTPWLPLSWAGRGLVALGESDWPAALLNLGVTLVLAAGIFAVALVTAERLYYTGWSSMQTVSTRKKPARRRAPANGAARPNGLSRLADGWIPPAVRALVVKDYYTLRRDLRNLSQLVTPLIFGVIYTFILLRDPDSISGRNEMPAIVEEMVSNLSLYINVGMSLFVSWMLVARLGGMGFSQEGKSFWMLKTAPIKLWQLIGAKFSVAYIPGLLIGLLFLVALAVIQQAALSVLWFTAPAVALIVAGNAGIQLTFGITGANMEWSDPRQMQKGSAGCLSTIISLLFLPLSFALFFLPPLGAALLGLPEWIGQLAGLIIGGAFSLSCAFIPLKMVSARVLRLGEGE